MVAEFFVEPRSGMTMKKAAGHVAAESSIGTWTDIATMNPDIAHKLRPSVYSIKGNYIKIAYPCELFEPGNMPQILSSIAGNIFGMKDVANIRLMDINFPRKLVNSFKGPRYGIDGIRKILGVSRRPLVGTIVKPKVGLSEKQHSEVAYDAWAGGLDIVKDDENLSSMSFNKFKKRINLTLKKRDRAEKETGEKKIYMPNCTAETFEMLKRAEYVKQNGGEYCMVDILTCGWSSLQTFRNNVRSVIHAHRAGHGAFTRYEKQGITMLAIAKIARLIGVDQLHIGTANVGKMEGSASDVCEIEDEIEKRFITERGHVLEQRWHDVKPVFAVASGGLHPGGTAKVMRYMGKNIVMQYGGGCHGHPDGTFAGAKAIRQSVDASMKGIGLAEYAKKHKELKVALDKFGIKR
jgi:ribulose-bisphosphate carboxylase large chain